MKNKKKSALIILFAEAFLFAGYFVFSKFKSKKYLNDNFTESQERQSDIQSDKGEIEQRDLIQPEKDKFEIVAQDLIIPWEIFFAGK